MLYIYNYSIKKKIINARNPFQLKSLWTKCNIHIKEALLIIIIIMRKKIFIDETEGNAIKGKKCEKEVKKIILIGQN